MLVRKRNTEVLAVLLGLLLLYGCASNPKPTTLPPGALNQFDATSYQSLMGAQATLAAAKTDYLAGKYGPQTTAGKQAMNSAIQAYNTAEAAWQAYHAGKGGDQAALQVQIGNAAIAVTSFIVTISQGGK